MKKRSVRELADKILEVLRSICQSTTPGKKMVQKLVYLVERKGMDLGLDFRIHFYGPYSAELDHFLHFYEAENLLEIDTSGPTHKIIMSSTKEDRDLAHSEEDIVNYIIERYAGKTPLELEVLTTTDFVACDLERKNELSTDSIVAGVRKIKGSKFTNREILDSVTELHENGFLN